MEKVVCLLSGQVIVFLSRKFSQNLPSSFLHMSLLLAAIVHLPGSLLTFVLQKRAFAKYWDKVDDPRDISGVSRFLSGGIGGLSSQLSMEVHLFLLRRNDVFFRYLSD